MSREIQWWVVSQLRICSENKFNLGKKLRLGFFNTKMTKSDYISKTKNRTKNIIYAINELRARSIQIYPVNLATFRRKLNFWGAVWTPVAPKRYAIWNCTPINFLISLRIFYVEMATSVGEEALHILNCDRAQWYKIKI